jgi:hypothetical protein
MRRWVRVAGLFALVAACGGRVEQKQNQEPPSGGGAGRGGSGGVGHGAHGGALGAGGSTGGVGGTNDSGGTGGFSCFVAGTRIATPSGATAIEELEVGDIVLAYDERAARVVPRPVTARFVHDNHSFGVLTTSDGRALGVTANHPVYLPDEDRYVEAGQLRGDERLLGLGARAAAPTSTISAGYAPTSGAPATVFNISVAGEHNYFAEGVLVHNKSCGTPSWSGSCRTLGGCIDPSAPSAEYVKLNQPIRFDAGVFDAGDPLDGGADADGDPGDADDAARELPVETAICRSELVEPPYLAFDVRSDSALPVLSIYLDGMICNGWLVGEIWLSGEASPPASSWTTQCVRLPLPGRERVTIVPKSEGTYVDNPRFVSGCACARVLKNRPCASSLGPDDPRACE